MDVVYSAEVRWFFQGEMKDDVRHWFDGNNEESRKDIYLLFPGCESVGVKQREGKFEIKALRGSGEAVHFPKSISGRSDGWIKWSYSAEGVLEWLSVLNKEQNGWLEIEKKRWLRKFLIMDNEPKEISFLDEPESGCNVELTKLIVNKMSWWTFGFEAFGTPDSVSRDLNIVASDFFEKIDSTPPSLNLNTIRSCSYPVWLNIFINY